jgi:hypothetical protein
VSAVVFAVFFAPRSSPAAAPLRAVTLKKIPGPETVRVVVDELRRRAPDSSRRLFG